MKGQVLVANVVLNRHRSPRFTDGIYNVIHQPTQFTPVSNGAGAYARATPTSMQWQAVAAALDGVDHSHGATFFHSLRGITPDVWHERAVADGQLIRLFDHGGHRFYREA